MKKLKIAFVITLPILILACATPTKEEQVTEIESELQNKRGTIVNLKKEIKELEEKKDSLEGNKGEEFTIVAASPLKTKTFKSYVKVHGVVATDKSINVVPEGMGIIRKVLVKRGSKVKAGQALAYLDSDVLNKNIKELQTSLDFATTVYDKQKSLHDKNVGTELQYLEAKNRKESLEQSLSTLKTQKSKMIITSPVSGTIDELFGVKGEMATQGQPFARIVNTSNVYAEANVSEKFISKIKVGDEVLVQFPYSEKEVAVKVTYKSNYINPNNRTFKVHASLSKLKEEFVPNMLTVLKLRDNYIENSVVINNTAISTDIDGDYVFTLQKKGKQYEVVKTPIKRGTTFENESLILKGLKANDLMITERYQTLVEGDLVDLK